MMKTDTREDVVVSSGMKTTIYKQRKTKKLMKMEKKLKTSSVMLSSNLDTLFLWYKGPLFHSKRETRNQGRKKGEDRPGVEPATTAVGL